MPKSRPITKVFAIVQNYVEDLVLCSIQNERYGGIRGSVRFEVRMYSREERKILVAQRILAARQAGSSSLLLDSGLPQ